MVAVTDIWITIQGYSYAKEIFCHEFFHTCTSKSTISCVCLDIFMTTDLQISVSRFGWYVMLRLRRSITKDCSIAHVLGQTRAGKKRNGSENLHYLQPTHAHIIRYGALLLLN